MIGRTIGSYKIVDKLGEGGMGEVYLARDAALQRDVAINIAQVYGFEGTALVMEFVDGEDRPR